MKLLFLDKIIRGTVFLSQSLRFGLIPVIFTVPIQTIAAQICSNNPVSECVVKRQFDGVAARIDAIIEKIAAEAVEPLTIYAQMQSDLRPQTILGPTNYSGSGDVTLIITNNTYFPIQVSCTGTISMKAYSGATITNGANQIVSTKAIHINSEIISPDDNKPVMITQSTGNFTSISTPYASTLWGASLGTQPREPLDCTVTSFRPDEVVIHVFVPVAYV